MPAKMTWLRWCSTALRRAAPVKSPTSTKHTSGRSGSSLMAPFSGRPPVHSTTASSPWAASTESACSARDRDDNRDALCVQIDGLAHGLGDHGAGHRVDGGAAQLEAEARLGDHPHPPPAVQLETRLVAPAHGGGQPRAVGHVGVVAGVLDHHRLGFLAWYEGAFVHLETDPLAVGQPDFHGVLHLAGVQRGGGRLGRGGRAGPGGPAGAQRLLPDLRGPGQVGLAQLGILAHVWPLVSRSCFLAWGSALRYPWKWPGWYRCERLPAVCSPGPTSTSVCFQSLRSFIVAARVSS